MTAANSTSYVLDKIQAALRTQGGHLSVGRRGYSLRFGEGGTLSGYDVEREMKGQRRAIPRLDRIAARGSAYGRTLRVPLPQPARTRGGRGVPEIREERAPR